MSDQQKPEGRNVGLSALLGHAIWWLSQENFEQMGNEPQWPTNVPEYVRDQWADLRGRNGRGRLWAASGTGLESIDWPAPETPISLAAGKCGGIVLHACDAWTVAALPGFLTDTALHWFALHNAGDERQL